MFEFEKPRIEIEEISEDNKYGRFVVEPLEIRGVAVELPQRIEAEEAGMLLLPFLERRANGERRAVAREEVGRTRYPLINEVS